MFYGGHFPCWRFQSLPRQSFPILHNPAFPIYPSRQRELPPCLHISSGHCTPCSLIKIRDSPARQCREIIPGWNLQKAFWKRSVGNQDDLFLGGIIIGIFWVTWSSIRHLDLSRRTPTMSWRKTPVMLLTCNSSKPWQWQSYMSISKEKGELCEDFPTQSHCWFGFAFCLPRFLWSVTFSTSPGWDLLGDNTWHVNVPLPCLWSFFGAFYAKFPL